MSNTVKIHDLTVTAMMAALIFCGTFFFKLPSAFGYTHLGDSLLILSICLLGTKKSMYAGAIGAGLADMIGGYAVWIVPTFCIKALYAYTMGSIMHGRFKDFRYSWLAGAIAGGLLQICLYTMCRVPLYGPEAALISIGRTEPSSDASLSRRHLLRPLGEPSGWCSEAVKYAPKQSKKCTTV